MFRETSELGGRNLIFIFCSAATAAAAAAAAAVPATTKTEINWPLRFRPPVVPVPIFMPKVNEDLWRLSGATDRDNSDNGPLVAAAAIDNVLVVVLTKYKAKCHFKMEKIKWKSLFWSAKRWQTTCGHICRWSVSGDYLHM